MSNDQKSLDRIVRAGANEGIRRGLEDVKAGRVYPASQVLAELREKHQNLRKIVERTNKYPSL